MVKHRIALLISFLAVLHCSAQSVLGTHCDVLHSSTDAYSFSLHISDVAIVPHGEFATIDAGSMFGVLQDEGKPQLPIFRQIIAVPQGANPTVRFVVADRDMMSLGAKPLQPAQPHTFKNHDPRFSFDSSVYMSQGIFLLPIVKVEELGQMCGIRLFRVAVSPFEYNPAKNEVLFYRNVHAEVLFDGANVQATARELDRHVGIPAAAHVANRSAFEPLQAHTRQVPTKYVVVAQDTFRHALQPFLQWKRQKGFNVVEMYTSASDTCTYIRSRLDSLWHAATPLDPSPAYITIVGDVDHVPSFGGKIRISGIGSHVTDLYYAEFTGDFYPDAAIGRISVADTAELAVVLKKMMDYEQYHFADTAFLDRTVVVAGRESRTPAPTVTNGQVNYLRNNLLGLVPSLDTHYYYNPQSATMLPEIVGNISQGVSLLNYTSHCLSTGWHNPSYTAEGVDTLSNYGRYFFAVNNCCLSSRYSESRCFGEALLRRAGAGAIGVIGAANETLWEEDYYFAVGAKPVSLNPSYDPSQLGSFDRFLHRHSEPYSETAATAGEILQVGNFGLTQMGMVYENYYWEIYNLLGDPSMMPYFGVPQDITLVHPDSVPAGTTQITLQGTPYARVALVQDALLLASVHLDSNGFATAVLLQPLDTGILLLTATAQFYKPLIDTVIVFSQNIPKMVIASATVSDSFGTRVADRIVSSGSAYSFDILLQNYGGDTAKNVTLTLQSADGKCNVPAATYHKTFVLSHDTARANGTFTFVPNPSLPDNEVVSLVATVFSDNADTCVRRFDFLVSSALVETGSVSVVQNGAPVTQLLQGETYTLKVPINNNGSGVSDIVSVSARIDNGGVVSLPDTIRINALRPQGSDTAEFVFSVAANAASYIDIAIATTHRGNVAKNYVRLPLGSAVETFESGDFAVFAWDTSHPNCWIIDASASRAHAGAFCARSAAITHKQQSKLSISLTTIVDDSISFWRRTSSEQGSDFLAFLIDGQSMDRWSGSGRWERKAYFVPSGQHEFTWVYEKDGSINGDDDCVWIDDIRFPLYQTDTNGQPPRTVGVAVADVEHGCRVYPNPAKDYFEVENSGTEPVEITITDAFGRKVGKITAQPSEKTRVGTEKMRSGIYVLLFTDKNHTFAKKIIIAKRGE